MAKNKYALVTVAVDVDHYISRTGPIFASYAKRHGMDYHAYATPSFFYHPILKLLHFTNRFRVLRRLNQYFGTSRYWILRQKLVAMTRFLKRYDRIIYLDATCVIHPDCPKLLELVPETQLGAVNEVNCGRNLSTAELEDFEKAYGKYSSEAWVKRTWLNSGVLVLSKCHRKLVRPPWKLSRYSVYGDQGYLNAQIQRHSAPIHELGQEYNLIGSRIPSYLSTPKLNDVRIAHVTGGYPGDRTDCIDTITEEWYGRSGEGQKVAQN
ncbi:MAG: hypothetical protein CMK36_02980 [Porticoccaceae bacterium]|nr:hypothetical protein [Porticoccaceae bacterium]